MSRWVLAAALIAFSSPEIAGAIDLAIVLKSVERRYNSPRTLALEFTQRYQGGGARRVETGTLLVRRPGKMRWEYTNPAGKLFVSDGDHVFFYSPQSRRVEVMRAKESGDARMPLAFLFGNLNFERDFVQYRHRESNGSLIVAATPRSKRAPFREVEFTAAPDGRISSLRIAGIDGATMEFEFRGERRNPEIALDRFQIAVPEGVEIVRLRDDGAEDR